MPKVRDYQLTEEEIKAVEAAIRRDKRNEVRQRCTTIRILHQGYKPEQVAEMQAVSIPTIERSVCHGRWILIRSIHGDRLRGPVVQL